MEFPSEEHESFIVIPHTFTANRLYNEDEDTPRMSAATITLKIACCPLDDDDMDASELGTRAMVGFQRLKVWLEAVLDGVILIDVNSNLLEELQETLANQIMYVPGQPDDSMLAVVLHSKIKAITKDLLDIHSISLTASDTYGIERLYRNLSGEYPLPDMEYFNGDTEHKTPWWTRPTIDICEYAKDEDGEVPIALYEVDPLSEIGKEYLTNNQEADIIVFDVWKNKDE